MYFRGDYAFLSNFYPVEVEYDGIVYSTPEHAYQAAKFVEHEAKLEIQKLNSPGQAKRISRKVEFLDRYTVRRDWHNIKIGVMYAITKIKFSDPTLRELLMSVEEPIVEHNDWGDTFWGVCDGEGRNELGRILETVKMEIYTFTS